MSFDLTFGLDGVDQSIFNMTHHSVLYQYGPLAVHGVIPAGPGSHQVQIYATISGGHMVQGDSHLQVLAITR